VKNVTITLKEEVARWARIQAAEHDTSVSRLVGEMLEEKMRQEQRYHDSLQQYFSRGPQRLKAGTVRYPDREDLHERHDLR